MASASLKDVSSLQEKSRAPSLKLNGLINKSITCVTLNEIIDDRQAAFLIELILICSWSAVLFYVEGDQNVGSSVNVQEIDVKVINWTVL